jgi:hypothetical protein
MSWEIETVNQQLRKQQKDIEYVRELNYSLAPGINIGTSAFGYGSSGTALVPKSGFTAFQPMIHGMGAIVSGTFVNGGGTNDQISLYGTTVIVDWSTWVILQSYIVNQVVKSTLSSDYYKCTSPVTSVVDPSLDPVHWTIDNTDAIALKTINGTLNDGQIITLKPRAGKTVVLKTGGNINITSDVTIGSSDVVFIQYFQDNSPANQYNVIVSKSSASAAYLPIAGGSMIGPIGFTHQVCNIVASVLDIASSANSSYVSITGGGPNLQGISAVIPTDAFLILYNISGGDLTLKQATGAGMNIDTFTHSDVTFSQGDTIILVYNHSPGIWHQITGGLNGFANQSLSNLTNPTSINKDLIPHATTDFLNLGNDSHVWAIGNFSVLANVSNVIFGTNASGTRWIRGQGAGGIVYNVLNTEAHSMQVNFVEYFNVRAGIINATGIFTVSGQSNLNGNVLTDTDGTHTVGGSGLRFIINGINYLGLRKGAPTPSVIDIPSGYFQVMKDSRQIAGVGVKLWYNDAGTLVSTTLS